MTKKEAIEKLKKNGNELKNLVSFQDDKDVVLQALKKAPKAFRFASEQLKKMKKFY